MGCQDAPGTDPKSRSTRHGMGVRRYRKVSALSNSSDPSRIDLESALQVILTHSRSVTGAAAAIGRSYSWLLPRIKSGEVATFDIGRETRIWLTDIQALTK